MSEAVSCFLSWNNDHHLIVSFQGRLGQGLIDIVVINLQSEKSSNHIQMIIVPTRLSEVADEVPRRGEATDRGTSCSEMFLLIAVDY